MSVRSLCVGSHPVLRQRARRIEVFTTELRRLARDMIETMYANEGIGLAAPQVGQNLQLFVANPSQERGRELVVVNPVLLETTGRTSVVEGCLSVPNVWERVTRSARVRIIGQDLAGRPLDIRGEGLIAIVFQHEIDHLDGKLFIDRLSWFRRRRLELRVGHAACV